MLILALGCLDEIYSVNSTSQVSTGTKASNGVKISEDFLFQKTKGFKALR